MKILPIETKIEISEGNLAISSLYDYNEKKENYFFPFDANYCRSENLLKGQYEPTLSPMAINSTNDMLGCITVTERMWNELIGSDAPNETWCYYITGVYFCYNEHETSAEERILNRMLKRLLIYIKCGWNTNDRHHFTYIAFKADHSLVLKELLSQENKIWQIQRYKETDLYYIKIADVIEDDRFKLDFIKHLCLNYAK